MPNDVAAVPDGYLLRRYADAAMCHPKTIKRYFTAPETLRPIVRARVESALRKLGVLPKADR